MRRISHGFTLIELLAVIAIIGTLASIVLTSLNAAKSRARDGQRVAEIQEVYKALELYEDSHPGKPPKCSDPGYVGGCDITTLLGEPHNIDSSQDGHFLDFLVSAGLLPELKDPINTGNYFYGYGNGEFPDGSGVFYNFIIGSLLENSDSPALHGSFKLGIPGSENFYIIAEPQ